MYLPARHIFLLVIGLELRNLFSLELAYRLEQIFSKLTIFYFMSFKVIQYIET